VRGRESGPSDSEGGGLEQMRFRTGHREQLDIENEIATRSAPN
jgi:hypothetical protein